MKNPKTLDNEKLIHEIRALVREESRITVEILHFLKEIEKRKLYCEFACASLFAFCTRELKYSEESAQRRIGAMRLIKEQPEVEEKIRDGALSLSVVSQAQSFFRKEEKAGHKLSLDEKKQVLHELEGFSSREAEKKLLSKSLNPEVHVNEQIKPLTPELSAVKLVLNEKTLKDLERLRGLLAHSHPELSLSELIALLAKKMIETLDPGEKKIRERKTPEATSDVGSGERKAIPAAVKREIWKRDGSRCSFVDPRTGRRCASRHRLQIDHCRPVALGGGNEIGNLRLLCAQHNGWVAAQTFGQEKMQRYWKP